MKQEFLTDTPELLLYEDRPQAVPAEETHARMPAEDTAGKVTRAERKTGMVLYFTVALVSTVLLFCALLFCVGELPRIGAAENNPTANDIYTEYIENGIEKTGAVNFVTGMILDYRAFDTLGESFVLFTSINCALILLDGFTGKRRREEDTYRPSGDPVLSIGCSVLVPLILLFGIYVILNGSVSPGGGFSGGAIMGAGLIIYAIAFGFESSERFFKDRTFRAVSAIALLAYCASKTYSFLTGAMGVPSGVWLGIPGTILSGGIIFILNVAVGMVVTCTMFGFYSLFSKGEIG